MKRTQWLEYYRYKADRPMKREKLKEMVTNCGGLLPLEKQAVAEVRILAEIRALPKTTPQEEVIRGIVKEEIEKVSTISPLEVR